VDHLPGRWDCVHVIGCIANVPEVRILPNFKSVIQLTPTSCLLLPPETRSKVKCSSWEANIWYTLFKNSPFWGTIFKTHILCKYIITYKLAEWCIGNDLYLYWRDIRFEFLSGHRLLWREFSLVSSVPETKFMDSFTIKPKMLPPKTLLNESLISRHNFGVII
jgi:hypothetical protein